MLFLSGPSWQEAVHPYTWRFIMRLAGGRGWRPSGRFEPVEQWVARELAGTPGEWSAAADKARSNPVRILVLTDDDARRLGEALAAAIPDIPEHDAWAHKSIEQIDEPGAGTGRVLPRGTPLSPYEFFSGQNRGPLHRFIERCRVGGFTISQ